MKLPDEYWSLFLDSLKTRLEMLRKVKPLLMEYSFHVSEHFYPMCRDHKDELKELFGKPTTIWKEYTQECFKL